MVHSQEMTLCAAAWGSRQPYDMPQEPGSRNPSWRTHLRQVQERHNQSLWCRGQKTVTSRGNRIGGAGNVLDLHLGSSYGVGHTGENASRLFLECSLRIYRYRHVTKSHMIDKHKVSMCQSLWPPGQILPAAGFVEPSSCCKKNMQRLAHKASASYTPPLYHTALQTSGSSPCHPPASPFSSTQTALTPADCPGLLRAALPAGCPSSLESLRSPLGPSWWAGASCGRCVPGSGVCGCPTPVGPPRPHHLSPPWMGGLCDSPQGSSDRRAQQGGRAGGWEGPSKRDGD